MGGKKCFQFSQGFLRSSREVPDGNFVKSSQELPVLLRDSMRDFLRNSLELLKNR